MTQALIDVEALIRRTAVESMPQMEPKTEAELLGPILYDSVKAVRMEAVRRLAGEPSKHLSKDQQRIFQTALSEFESAMVYSSDFAFGRYNLANLYSTLDREEDAIQNYEAAIHIDGLFYPAKVNMAMLYNKMGKNEAVKQLFMDIVNTQPDLPEVAYSLGLLLVEMKEYEDAAHYLAMAARGMPGHARVHYNLGLLLQQLNQLDSAESALQQTLTIEPDNMDYLYAMADHYIKRGRLNDARHVARLIISKHPENTLGPKLLSFIDQALKGKNK